MNGITIIETETFQSLIDVVNRTNDLIAEIASASKVEDKYLTVAEALEYVGFGKTWLNERADKIGYYQAGTDRRFKRADLDAYMAKHFIQRKTK